MADENSTTGTVQSPASSQGEQGNPSPNPVQDATEANASAQTGDGDNTDSAGGAAVEEGEEGSKRSIETLPKWAQDHIRSLRDEAASRRRELREKEEEQRLAQMTDEERIREEAAREAREQERQAANERIKNLQVRARLAEERIVNPEKTMRLLDTDPLEVDDDGNVTGLDSAIEQLKTEFPNLVQGASTQPNLGNREPASEPMTMNDLIRSRFGR